MVDIQIEHCLCITWIMFCIFFWMFCVFCVWNSFVCAILFNTLGGKFFGRMMEKTLQKNFNHKAWCCLKSLENIFLCWDWQFFKWHEFEDWAQARCPEIFSIFQKTIFKETAIFLILNKWNGKTGGKIHWASILLPKCSNISAKPNLYFYSKPVQTDSENIRNKTDNLLKID